MNSRKYFYLGKEKQSARWHRLFNKHVLFAFIWLHCTISAE